jgi:hypothetical protein
MTWSTPGAAARSRSSGSAPRKAPARTGASRSTASIGATSSGRIKHEVWCIEDPFGACLRHTDHVHGQEASRDAAVAFATAMIADGRMPTPQAARARWEAEHAARTARRKTRQTLSDKPENVRARERAKAKRDHSALLGRAARDAEACDDEETPLWESIADAFDFSDPNLWRSNSFSSVRPRLVIWMRSVVARLEYDVDDAGKRYKPYGFPPEPADRPKKRVAALKPKLVRAREILALLEGDQVQSQAAD